MVDVHSQAGDAPDLHASQFSAPRPCRGHRDRTHGAFHGWLQTIFQAATQRFTTSRSRGRGFNLWYLFMNVGATLSGLAVDFIRLVLKVANVHVFTMGAITAGLCLLIGETMVRKEEQAATAAGGGGARSASEVEHKKPARQSCATCFASPPCCGSSS